MHNNNKNANIVKQRITVSAKALNGECDGIDP